MERFLISCLAVAVLGWPASGQKVEEEKPDRSRIVHVQTSLNHLTILEMSEAVSAVAVGSAAFRVEWRENTVFIEPSEAGTATNLFVWTRSGRFNYELDPAGTVPEMVFAIDQQVANLGMTDDSPKLTVKPAEPSPAEILLASRPVRSFGGIPGKNRVAVYVTNLLERDGHVLVRYSIRNGTDEAYLPGAPEVVALEAPRCRESLYALKGSELGSNEALRLKSGGEIPVEVANSAIQSSRIEPAQETTGVIVIKLSRRQTQPAVIRLIFLASSKGPVSATLVL